jgi:nitrite reductase/ring-hydroxylating ferredoxin subunit
MDRLAHALLRVYPRAWRDRYAAEVGALLAERGVRLADLIDLLRGALDAHVSPQVASRLVAARTAPAVVAPATTAGLPARVAQAERRPVRHGAVDGVPSQQVSRRAFMRRVLGAGVGLISLEFMGGTIAFLWPNITDGLGGEFRVGTLAEIISSNPDWAKGWPMTYHPAASFLVNAPAARELAMGREASLTAPAADEILALWRKCPHLGCMVPVLCPEHRRFQCRCHASTYNIIGEKLERGPAPRGLDRFPVRIDEAGVVIVDTRQVIRGAPPGRVTFRDPFPQDAGCE